MRPLLRRPLLLLCALFLGACEGLFSSHEASFDPYVGTWHSYDGPAISRSLEFDGSSFRFGEYLKGCRVRESSGRYWVKDDYSRDTLFLNVSTLRERVFRSNAPDSATVCSSPLSESKFEGKIVIATENRSSRSFTAISFENGTTETRREYAKQ